MYDYDIIKNGIKVAQISSEHALSQQEIDIRSAPYLEEPKVPTQKEKDLERYTKRSIAKNIIIAEIATENMGRIRSGEWTTADIVGLTQDESLRLVMSDVHSLSFELAAIKLMAITNPLITDAIKAVWLAKLQAHFYL
jgi:hypothetical protein